MTDTLEACQAREKVLRGWIETRCRFDSLNMDLSNWRKFVEEYHAFPTDDTALKDLLTAERERCISAVRNARAGVHPIDAIRALGSQ